MNSRAIKLAILLTPGIIAVTLTIWVLNSMLRAPADADNKQIVLVEIAQGKGLTQIATDLTERGLIRSVTGMKLLARLKTSGQSIKAGEYELSASMTPLEILRKLTSGEVVKRRVLVKEGASILEIAASVDQAGVVSKDDFLTATQDKDFLRKAGIDGASVEGYLFPETYFFSRPITAPEVLWTMFEEAERHWNPEFSNQLDLLGMTRHQILTLASIIEKETGKVEEMPIISSVFHNRLREGMRLESDPTVIYGISNFNGNITKRDLQDPHPYNTYQNPGLPPGPIANPSERAIRAALYPAETKYLFFVADGTGGHVFSTNYKEHSDAVAQYQLKRAAPAAHEPTQQPDAPTPAPPTR